MPGPIYTAGRYPLTSDIVTAGGVLQGAPNIPVTSNKQKSAINGASTPLVKLPPTFPASADLVEGTGTRSFSALTTLANDWIVVQCSMEDDSSVTTGMTPSATGLTFQLINDSGTTPSSRARVFQWAAFDSTGGSRTITMTPQNSGVFHRARATVVRGSDGPGGRATINTAQTIPIQKLSPNSALIMSVNDWSTGAIGSPVWVPGGTTVASQQGTNATYIFGRYDNSGIQDTVTAGISSPSYTTPAVAVMEMLGQSLIPSTFIREILSNEASGANVSVTTSAATNAGDLILVFHANNFNDAANVGPPTTGTWTLKATGDNGTNSSHIKVWSGSATGGAQTITVTPTPSNEEHGVIVVVFKGAYTVDGAAGNNGAASASQVAPSVTTTGTNNILFTAPTSIGAVGGNYTPPVGVSKQAQINDGSFAFTAALGTEMLSAAGATGTRTWTFSSAIGAWASVSIAVNVDGTASSGPTTVNGSAALTSQSTLTAPALVTELPTVALTSDSTMVAAGVVSKVGIAALTSDSTLTASGIVSKIGVAALSGQSTLVATAVDTVLASSALSSQSNQNSSALVTALGASALSSQSNLIASGIVSKLGIAALISDSTLSATGTVIGAGTSANLSAQSSLTVTALVTELASAALSGQSTLTAFGTLARLGVSALTSQSTLTVAGLVTRLGVAPLTSQSILTVNGFAATTGSAALSSQSVLTADGTIGLPPTTVTMTSQSSMTVSGLVTKLASAALTSDSTLVASGKANSFGTAPLSGLSTLNASGTVGKLGTAVLSSQSVLTAAGFIPAFITGSASLSSITSLIVSAQASPPWVLTLIEFSSVDISNTTELSHTVSSNKEVQSDVTNSYEGKSSKSVGIELI